MNCISPHSIPRYTTTANKKIMLSPTIHHLILQFLFWLSLFSVTFSLPNLHDPRGGNSNGSKRNKVEERSSGRNVTVLDHAATAVRLEFVTNSGICETTPGVNQYSGYISLEPGQYTFFWLFEARKNANTAPLVALFGGGPGCSSTSAIFDSGPCRFINNESTPSLNPYSWNNNFNMLYIDQPFGAGLSISNSTQNPNGTDAAAALVWKFIQVFHDQFPQYESRDFGMWSTSYGGHFLPAFADYFIRQNAAISTGAISGSKINLIALGIGNGWFDPLIQIQSIIDFSYNNTYSIPIINATSRSSYTKDFQTYCAPQLEACRDRRSAAFCLGAYLFCSIGFPGSILERLMAEREFDVYDIRRPSRSAVFNTSVALLPTAHETYLLNEAVMEKIGATRGNYTPCSIKVYEDFLTTGDASISYLPNLTNAVNAGINTVLYAGDADWLCNWKGNQLVAEAITYRGQIPFKTHPMANYTVDGALSGTFKSEGNLTFLRVFQAGHDAFAENPLMALQVFQQTMIEGGLKST